MPHRLKDMSIKVLEFGILTFRVHILQSRKRLEEHFTSKTPKGMDLSQMS